LSSEPAGGPVADRRISVGMLRDRALGGLSL